jgi:hypothetical protein
MSKPAFLPHGLLVLLLLVLAVPRTSGAESADWPDADGSRFSGKPAGTFGSLALFRTKEKLLKRVPLRVLSPEDCQRFYRAIAERPDRAARWIDAKSPATGQLIGNTLRVEYQYRKLVPADLSILPEPELLIVFYGYQNWPGSWLMLNNIGPNYRRIQGVYPGLVHGVFFGLAPSVYEHESMAITAWMPWLVTKYSRQDQLPALTHYAPNQAPSFLVMTRHGDPLLQGEPTNLNVVRDYVDALIELLWTTHPYNNDAWIDRAHYGRAVRPLQFANASTGPELIGNPLRADGLRQRGISRIEARLEVDAEGKVTAATLLPGSVVPEKMAGQLTAALRRSALLLPAIDHGQAVASTYDYVQEIPPAIPQAEADALWLERSMRGQVLLRDWLLLTSIPVSQQEFDDVQSVGPDGKVILRTFEVNQAKVSRASQLSAFHTDFFGEAGAASVLPQVGQTQVVDGHTLTWRAVKSLDGYVDLKYGQKGPSDYCVGYAWAEVEVSADIQAWLGIGSDDGLKLWHNGELVLDRWRHRISQLDDDVVPIKLKAGKNHLLLKVQNMTRDWSFVARLRYRDR